MRRRRFFSSSSSSSSPSPGGEAIPPNGAAKAAELKARLVRAEDELRRFCRNPNFGGDGAACRSFADQVRAFLDGLMPKVEAALAAGDAHRFSALMLAGSRILAAAEGGPNSLGQGLIITDEVAKTAGEIVEATKKVGLGVGFIAASVAALLLVLKKLEVL